MKFKVKKKGETTTTYEVYEIVLTPIGNGQVSSIFFMYDTTSKKFVSDMADNYEIVPEQV